MTTQESDGKRLERLLAVYEAPVARVARRALLKMRAMLPGALELVYDNYNALVIGFGPTEQASDAICSIVLYPRWVSLFFLRGATLRDPDKVLRGKGARVRHIVLTAPEDLDAPPIKALVAQAARQTDAAWPQSGRRKVIIKSVSGRKRRRARARAAST